MDALIRVSRLTKRYGSTLAVDDVSFEVRAREVVGFLGPNGAGKSTTLRILAGFLGRTAGDVKIAGFDLDDDPIEAKKRIGYMPETVPLYGEMRVREYLTFRAELKGVARRGCAERVDEAMAKAKVADVASSLIAQLSKGYRQRVGLADALIARPPILILDEPTAGLDPNQIRDVRDVVKELGREHAVFLSTHILSEVEATCDRVIVLRKGKIVAEGPTASIRRGGAVKGVVVVVRGDRREAVDALARVKGVAQTEAGAEADGIVELSCRFAEGADRDEVSEEIAAALVTAGLKLRELRPMGGGLEEVFAELTR